jgi:hypothetical protein
MSNEKFELLLRKLMKKQSQRQSKANFYVKLKAVFLLLTILFLASLLKHFFTV